MMRPGTCAGLLCWLAALAACATFSVEFHGPVVEATDGCTVTFLHDHARDRVRLYGVECPALSEPPGRQAKRITAALTVGNLVTVKAWGLDEAGRIIGIVGLPDGTILNQRLVEAGLARWDRRYPDEAELEKAEARARTARLGVWSVE